MMIIVITNNDINNKNNNNNSKKLFIPNLVKKVSKNPLKAKKLLQLNVKRKILMQNISSQFRTNNS